MQRLRNVILAVLLVVLVAAQTAPTHAQTSITATVSAISLNVRRAPSITSQVIGQIEKGTVVSAVGRDGSAAWIEAVTPLGDSWIAAKWVTLSGGDLSNLPVTDTGVLPFATVSAFPAVAVRAGPSLNYPTIGILLQGSNVSIIGHDAKSEWLQIQASNGIGWVQSQFLTIHGNPLLAGNTAPNAIPLVKNVNYRLLVRAAPDVNSAQIGELSYYQYARIVGTNANHSWWQIIGPFGTGWVSAKFVFAFGNLASVPVVA